MSQKSIPLSVRVTAEDADFLARLDVPGATTPSDKLRHLLSEARERHARGADYEGHLAMAAEMLGDARRRWRSIETQERLRSDLVRMMAEWLPETAALFASGMTEGRLPREGLVAFEAGLADRAVALAEGLMRLAVTGKEPCYEPQAVRSRIEQVIELAEIVGRADPARRKE